MSNRRNFIQKATLLSLGIPFLANCKSKPTDMAAPVTKGPAGFTLDKFGIQLWSVRDDMGIDPKGVLKALSDFGFTLIESFQSSKGVFWGMKPNEYKDYLTAINVSSPSTHCNPEYAMNPKLTDEFKKLAEDAASVGMKYLVNPYLGFLKTNDEFKKAADGMNKCGEICKQNGIRYAYHNHHYSFTEKDGVFPQDIMMQGTDPGLVDFEMDIYWVYAAKQDPIAWLKKYPNRFKLSHVKDRYKPEKIAEIEKTEKADPSFGVGASCVLGTGFIDFNNVLQVAKEHGMEYFIVEQERYDNSTPMADAQKDAAYMKKFII